MLAHPDDNRIRRALSPILRAQPQRFAEGLTLAQEAVRQDPRDPLTHYDLANVYREAENYPAAWQENEAALALQRFGSALTQRASIAFSYRGDVAAMRAALDELSPTDRAADRAVYYAMLCGLIEHRPERVVAAAALNSLDHIEDSNIFVGPKAWFLAQAYEMAGQKNSARLQWEAAERVMRDRLRTEPQSRPLRLQLAMTLARMGRTAEAAREVAPIESMWREQSDPYEGQLLARYYASTGDAAKAVAYLVNSGRMPRVPTLRLDPWWDKLRGTPEFDALLAHPPPMPPPIAPAPYHFETSRQASGQP